MGSPKKKKKSSINHGGAKCINLMNDEKKHSYAGVNYLTTLLETCPSR